MTFRSRFIFLLFLSGLVLTLAAHVPLPESVLNPKTPAEAWNVLRLAKRNIRQLLDEGRLAEIADQASVCSPALRTLADIPPGEHGNGVAEKAVRASIAVGALAQASQVGDGVFAEKMFESLQVVLKELGTSYEPTIVSSEIYFCPMHAEFCSTEKEALCPKCGMSLLMRRIPYSFIYVPPGESSVKLVAVAESPLVAGQEASVKVNLTRRDGSPVLLEDLMITHTKPIHLLIINTALNDYHHEHPVTTDIPGEYSFSFTPATNDSYRVFADLTPEANGVQEYTFGDLVGTAKSQLVAPNIDSLSSIVDGIHFVLTREQSDGLPLRAKQVHHLRVTMTDKDGKPMDRLEPVMNAFAHLVGFYEDYRTVVHLHPAGAEIVNQEARGGPSLDFKFYPPIAGFVRLYCQVVIDGKTLFAPFDLRIGE